MLQCAIFKKKIKSLGIQKISRTFAANLSDVVFPSAKHDIQNLIETYC